MSVCVDQREKLLKFFCQINLSFGVLVQILRGHCLAYEYVYPPVTSVLCDVLITLCTCNQSLTQSYQTTYITALPYFHGWGGGGDVTLPTKP